MAEVRIKRLPLGVGGLAYMSWGPIVRRGDADDIDRLAQCVEALRREYVTRCGLVLRILPSVGPPDWITAASDVFRMAGFQPAQRPESYRTFLLPLERPLEEIRSAFSHYWRRNLKRALRKRWTLRSGEDLALFEPVKQMHRALVRRKAFRAVLNADFYADLQPHLSESERFSVNLAQLDGETVGALVVSQLGDTCVGIVGATSEAGAKSYASYRLFWHVIESARERGFRWFDLGGIDPDANPGVYNFKSGMKGIDVASPGPVQIAPASFAARCVFAAENVYVMSRQMRQKWLKSAGRDRTLPAASP